MTETTWELIETEPVSGRQIYKKNDRFYSEGGHDFGTSEFDDDHRFQLIKCTSCGLMAYGKYTESRRGFFSRDSFTHYGHTYDDRL